MYPEFFGYEPKSTISLTICEIAQKAFEKAVQSALVDEKLCGIDEE